MGAKRLLSEAAVTDIPPALKSSLKTPHDKLPELYKGNVPRVLKYDKTQTRVVFLLSGQAGQAALKEAILATGGELLLGAAPQGDIAGALRRWVGGR